MIRTLLIAGVLVTAVLGKGQAQEQQTIRGEVVGVACYTNPQVSAGANVDARTSCSLSALKAGEPAGIVENKTGKLYIAISDDGTNISDKLLPNVAQLVDVTGKVQEKAGVNTIKVSEVRPVENTPSQAGAGSAGNTTAGNATGMPSGMLSPDEDTTVAPRRASGAVGPHDSLYNVTKAPGIHNASSKEIPGIPHRGTRYGEVYMNEGEPGGTDRQLGEEEKELR